MTAVVNDVKVASANYIRGRATADPCVILAEMDFIWKMQPP